jgi:hypothetical protein
VRGYVLLVANVITELHLDQLRIIRGQTLYQPAGHPVNYSLYVALNHAENSSDAGLRELGLKSLHEITTGNVMISNNNLLCHERSINWTDILADSGAQAYYEPNEPIDDYRKQCPPCHSECSSRHCWGSGPDMCQKMTRLECAKQCDNRCHGKESSDCCNVACAAGCTGPTSSDCLACRNNIDDGKCIESCPKLFIKGTVKRNPDGKYEYGNQCVKICPPNYIASDLHQACLTSCDEGKHMGPNGTCVDDCTQQGTCSQVCHWEDDYINSNNIDKLRNCTIIQGGLAIRTQTFAGDRDRNISQLRPKELINILKSITEINGFLKISFSGYFSNLSFLSSLKVIRGRDTTNVALEIMWTQLRNIGLNSLEEISHGDIKITDNEKLCYADTINWTQLTRSDRTNVIVRNNSKDCGQSAVFVSSYMPAQRLALFGRISRAITIGW